METKNDVAVTKRRKAVSMEELIGVIVDPDVKDAEQAAEVLGLNLQNFRNKLSAARKNFPEAFHALQKDLERFNGSGRGRSRLTETDLMALIAEKKGVSVDDVKDAVDSAIEARAEREGVDPEELRDRLAREAEELREKAREQSRKQKEKKKQLAAAE